MANFDDSTLAYSTTIYKPDRGGPRFFQRIIQAAQDIISRLTRATHGMLVGGDVGEVSTTTITLNPIEQLFLNGVRLADATPTINSSALGGGSFANNTHYFLYAYNNGGSIAYQLTTTVPNGAPFRGRFKNGTTTHVYLGWVRTDGSGNLLRARWDRGEYSFLYPQLVYSATGISIKTEIPLNLNAVRVIPAHAKQVRLQAVLTNGDTDLPDVHDVSFYRGFADVTAHLLYQLENSAGAVEGGGFTSLEKPFEFSIPSDSGAIAWHPDSAQIGIELRVLGFRE